MATMYPPRLPEAVRDKPGRRAEVLLYQQLSRLPDDFHVFYSVKWQAESRRGIQRDGEADFVIAHAERPLLVLEVKGGRVEYHGFADQWVSVDAHGRPRPGSVDPFDQARESCHALRRILAGQRDWRHDPLSCIYAVALTDVTLPPNTPLPPAANRGILLDAPALDDMAAALDGVYDHWRRDDPIGYLGADRLAVVRDLLDGWVTLPAGLSHAALCDRLVELTAEQTRTLDLLRRHRRVLIGGCAGSGKTVLALEKARRLAGEGRSVLLTCFNKLLGAHLRAAAAPGVTATHFHGLCAELAAEAGVPCEPEGTANQRFFDETLPHALIDAARRLDRRFDAIILDEAQDFKEAHWQALAELLRDPEQGVVYVFYDANQDLFTPDDHGLASAFRLLVDDEPYDLSGNCRTTLAIHRVAMAFQPGPLPDCRGPEGPPVTIAEYGGRREMARLARRTLGQWLGEDGLGAEEVVILTGHSPAGDSPFVPGTRLGDVTLTLDDPPGPGCVTVSTVQRFKGLERRAVILTDLDGEARPDLSSVLYVGSSRAQERLTVAIAESAPLELRRRLAEAAGA